LFSTLVAACGRSGVKTLYSEDLQNGAEIGGVTIVNPFEPIEDA
jgi:predicted nucleic acid-binding protein